MAEIQSLVPAAKKGDKTAFSKLYQEIYKDLYKFAFYCLKNETDAEDAVSEPGRICPSCARTALSAPGCLKSSPPNASGR